MGAIVIQELMTACQLLRARLGYPSGMAITAGNGVIKVDVFNGAEPEIYRALVTLSESPWQGFALHVRNLSNMSVATPNF